MVTFSTIVYVRNIEKKARNKRDRIVCSYKWSNEIQTGCQGKTMLKITFQIN